MSLSLLILTLTLRAPATKQCAHSVCARAKTARLVRFAERIGGKLEAPANFRVLT